MTNKLQSNINQTVQYTDIDYAQFMAHIEILFGAKDARAISRAYALAKNGHRKDLREGGVRYFNHPREVALIIFRDLRIEVPGLVIKALLHDIVEDTFILDLEAIELLFDSNIARSVRILTKEPKEGYMERLIEYGDWEDLVVKLVDRIHNCLTLDACSPEKQQRKVKETIDLFFPLIDVLRSRVPEKYAHIPDLIETKLSESLYPYIDNPQ